MTVQTLDRGSLEHSRLQSAVDVYQAERPRLFSIAYRILGSAAEADDVVQEVWVRWQRTDRTLVHNAGGFLSTAVSRLAINVLQAARTRHETAVTPWLEDLADSDAHGADGPEVTAERTEAAGLALRVLMERLNPTECAAFLLHHGFGYPYRRIAEVLDLSTANARQLVSRAHRRLPTARRRPVDLESYRRLVRSFVAAARAGQVVELEQLLAADVARHRA